MAPEIVSNGRPTGVKSEDVQRALDRGKVWELWICWGQSQMSGTVSGDLSDGGHDTGARSIYTLDPSGLLVPENYPLHSPPTLAPGARSPAHAFAQVRAAAGANIILAAAAEGGKGIAPAAGGVWYGPSTSGGSGSGGTHWQSIRDRVTTFLNTNKDIKVIVKGDIFAGGENEAFAGMSGAEFETWYNSAIDGWKASIPAAAGGDHSGWISVCHDLTEQLKTSGFVNTPTGTNHPAVNFQTISNQLQAMAFRKRGFALVSTTGVLLTDEGLAGTDGDIHYDGPSTIEMGRRLYAAVRYAEVNLHGSAKGLRADIQTFVEGTVYPKGECVYYQPENRIKKALVQTSSTYVSSEWQDLTTAATNLLTVVRPRPTQRYGLGTNLAQWNDGKVTGYAWKDLSKTMRAFTYSGAGTPLEDEFGHPDLLAGQSATTYLFDTLGAAGVNSVSTTVTPSATFLQGFVPLPIYKSGFYFVEATFDPAKAYAGFTLTAGGDGASATKIQSASSANGYTDIWRYNVASPGLRTQLTFNGPAKLTKLKIYHISNKATVDSEPFDAVFLDELSAFTLIRFMMSQNTNNENSQGHNLITGVSTRPRLRDITWSKKGVPLEWACRLCSAIQADMWWHIPFRVYNDAAFAQEEWEIIDKQLASGLRVYSEYSNEQWTGTAGAASTFVEGLRTTFGYPTTFAGKMSAYAQASQLYWEHLATAAGSLEKMLSRIVRVYGSQLANTGVTDNILQTTFLTGKAAGLTARDVCDALAVAPYYPLVPFFNPADGAASGGIRLSQFGLAKSFGAGGLSAWRQLIYLGTEGGGLITPNGKSLRSELNAAKALIDAHVTHVQTNYPGLQLIAYEGGSQVDTELGYVYDFNTFNDTTQIEALCYLQGDQRAGEYLEELVRYFHFKTGGGLFCHFYAYDTPTIAVSGSPAPSHFFKRYWGEPEGPTPTTSLVYTQTNRYAYLRTRSRQRQNPAPYILFDPNALAELPKGLLPGQFISSVSEGVVGGRRFYPNQVLRNDYLNITDSMAPLLSPIIGGDEELQYIVKQQTVSGGTVRQQFSMGKIDKLDQIANAPLSLAGFELYGLLIQHQEPSASASARVYAGRDTPLGILVGSANAPCAAFQVTGVSSVYQFKKAELYAFLESSAGLPTMAMIAQSGNAFVAGTVFSSMTLNSTGTDVGTTEILTNGTSDSFFTQGMQVNRVLYNPGILLTGKTKAMLRARSGLPASLVPGSTATASVLELTQTELNWYLQSAGADDTNTAGRRFRVYNDGTRDCISIRREDGTYVKIYVTNSNVLTVALA